MKKVQFSDGNYGVRANWWLGWHYVDLENPTMTWWPGAKNFEYCMGTEQQADKALLYRTGKHKVCRGTK